MTTESLNNTDLVICLWHVSARLSFIDGVVQPQNGHWKWHLYLPFSAHLTASGEAATEADAREAATRAAYT